MLGLSSEFTDAELDSTNIYIPVHKWSKYGDSNERSAYLEASTLTTEQVVWRLSG